MLMEIAIESISAAVSLAVRSTATLTSIGASSKTVMYLREGVVMRLGMLTVRLYLLRSSSARIVDVRREF